MAYIGSWKVEDNLTFSVTTHVATTGALNDADGDPNFRVYEDNTGTALLTGSMAKLDDTNTTGFYLKQIQITAASGFEKGKSYTIYKEGTVNSRKAAVSDHFQIEAEVDANAVSAVGLNVRTGTLNYVGTANALTDTVTVGTNLDKTGYTVSGQSYSPTVVVGTNNDKTGYSGVVTNNVVVGTNLDKTGYNVRTGTLNYVGTANVVVGSIVLTAGTIDDILDEVVEGTLTMRQMLRIFLSKIAGEASGGGTTTINFRDNADSKNRISMTVDSNGNRSAVTLDGS